MFKINTAIENVTVFKTEVSFVSCEYVYMYSGFSDNEQIINSQNRLDKFPNYSLTKSSIGMYNFVAKKSVSRVYQKSF